MFESDDSKYLSEPIGGCKEEWARSPAGLLVPIDALRHSRDAGAVAGEKCRLGADCEGVGCRLCNDKSHKEVGVYGVATRRVKD